MRSRRPLRPRAGLIFAGLLAILAPCLAAAPDARAGGAAAPIALMGLRLGMTPADVLAVLAPQAARVVRRTRPCGGRTGRCLATLRARTPDGWVEVGFAPTDASAGNARRPAAREMAWRIRLMIGGAGSADPRQVRAATVAHFGPPSGPSRMVWCPGGAPCPPRGPRLRLIRSAHGTSILSLSDPALRDPPAMLSRPGAPRSRNSPPAG